MVVDSAPASLRVPLWVMLPALCVAAIAFPASSSPAPDRIEQPAPYPRSVYFDPRDVSDQIPPELAATFDALVVSENADTTWLEQVREVNPKIKLLLFIAGSAVRDTIKDGWDPADTTTVQGLLKVQVVQNDWLLEDVTGNPITTWASPIFDTWAINLTPHCPLDPTGRRVSSWAAGAIARRFLHTGEGVASYTGWSGVLLDQMFNGISWVSGALGNGPIDADGDGLPDDPEELNEEWREEMGVYLRDLRSHVGDSFMITLNGDTVMLEDTDGQSFEDCLAGRSWLEDMYGYAYHHGGYLRNLALSRPGPNQFSVFYARYYDGQTQLPPHQFARLAAGSSCLGDGYYVLERFHDGVFEPFLTADTYTLDIGFPAGEMHRTVSDGDTLYARAFSRAFVQVNPNDRTVGGVPARDAAFTFYAPPDSLSVASLCSQAFVQWHVPAVSGNPQLLDGFEVAFGPLPFGEQDWHRVEVLRIKGEEGQFPAGDVVQARITGLQPGTWYHVAARSVYRRTHPSRPTATLAFCTPRDPAGWIPPPGLGPEGDTFWWDAEEGTPNGVVRALVEHRGSLYVAGDFTRVGDLDASHIARLDGDGWHALEDGLGSNVRALAVHDGRVIAGGDPTASGFALVAVWDGQSWETLEGLYGAVHALALWNGTLFAAGEFSSSVSALRAYSLARWQDGGWQLLSIGIPGESDPHPKRAVAVHGSRLAGEGLTILDGQPAPVVGTWTHRGWNPLGDTLVGSIHSLAVHNGSLVAGGRFSSVGGTAALSVARWDGIRWVNIGSGLTGDVCALASVNGVLLAGGMFEASGEMPLSNVARWDGTFWTSLGTGTDGHVLAIAGAGGRVFVGGAFASAGTRPSPFLARWDHHLWPIIDVGPTGTTAMSGGVLTLTVPSPNPSGSSSVLEYLLPRAADVRLIVFDAAGRAVRQLVDGRQPSGRHRIAWDGRDHRGRNAGPGIYVIQLRSDGQERSEKVVRTR